VGVGEYFQGFCNNLTIESSTRSTISDRYKLITRGLNIEFYDSDSDTYNSRYVGSYGRGTAIRGFSDLDMVFVMPKPKKSDYDNYVYNAWHRVLKSGCHIESHQHLTADKLARTISIDAVIAWRVMLLALLGRAVPEMPCELIFSPWECKLLERLQPLVAPDTIRGKKTLHRNCHDHYQPSWRGFE
jgi:hypothetical protein